MTILIPERLIMVKNKIVEMERLFHRAPNSVQLIAITKSQNPRAIKQAIAAGQFAFGENYVQESLDKIKQLKDHKIEWHFVGNIQSNKTKAIAENFTWVHSLCEVKIAERLNHYRSGDLAPLNICLQVNLDKESRKSGVYLEALIPFVESLKKFSHLKLRGLMAIPQAETSFTEQRKRFKKLRCAFEKLQQLGYKFDTLSMGMSGDFEAAIAEGATLVRIGSAIFGKRNSPNKKFFFS